MTFWYWLLSWLPFEWAAPNTMLFMKNALLAVLVVTPLFGLLSTMVVESRMAFFSDALGHSAFTGMAIANAIHDAQDLGLTVGEVLYDPFNPEAPGTVVQQDIAPQTDVPGGTRITFTVSGSENETSAVHTKVVEFIMPTDMEGMIKVEFEQDGAVVDSQYLSATMGTISYTFSGVAGSDSTVCAYFTSVEDDTTVVSPAQEIHF